MATAPYDQRDGNIWMNGKLVDFADAKISVFTHALHYGSGVFEGERCYKTTRGSEIFSCIEAGTPTPSSITVSVRVSPSRLLAM